MGVAFAVVGEVEGEDEGEDVVLIWGCRVEEASGVQMLVDKAMVDKAKVD